VILAQTTPALPDNTGYVAAAYLVFFALILIYVVIMASKLARFERELSELNQLVDERASRPPAVTEPVTADAEPEEAARR
jgi:CcmD family protein